MTEAPPPPDAFDLGRFIGENLPLTPVPTVPEIRLHLAHPGSRLGRLLAGDADAAPYWAYPWPGGLALARYVLDHPQTVRDRRVLDLGAGSGLVAIAAAQAGAAEVIAAEIDANAATALRMNALANAAAITLMARDLTIAEPPAVDLVLVGDLFYEEILARRVTEFLDRCVAQRIDVLVGDLGRKYLPRERLRALADYPVPDVGDPKNAPTRQGGVFSYQPEV